MSFTEHLNAQEQVPVIGTIETGQTSWETFQMWTDKHTHSLPSPSTKCYKEPMLMDGNQYSSNDSCFNIKQEFTSNNETPPVNFCHPECGPYFTTCLFYSYL